MITLNSPLPLDVNMFKIAAEIAGTTGIALVIFYLLFKAILRIIGSFEKKFRNKIIIIMLVMIWSITVLGMTGYIYASFKNEGGEQKTGNDIKEELGLSYYSSNIQLVSNLGNIPLQINNCTLDGIVSYLWLSFDLKRPYFRSYSNKMFKVVLTKIDDQNVATFNIEFNDKLLNAMLKVGEAIEFNFEDCKYRFIYTKKDEFETGISYWFKKRKVAHYKIEKIN